MFGVSNGGIISQLADRYRNLNPEIVIMVEFRQVYHGSPFSGPSLCVAHRIEEKCTERTKLQGDRAPDRGAENSPSRRKKSGSSDSE